MKEVLGSNIMDIEQALEFFELAGENLDEDLKTEEYLGDYTAALNTVRLCAQQLTVLPVLHIPTGGAGKLLCPECETEVEEEWFYCPCCGQRVETYLRKEVKLYALSKHRKLN